MVKTTTVGLASRNQSIARSCIRRGQADPLRREYKCRSSLTCIVQQSLGALVEVIDAYEQVDPKIIQLPNGMLALTAGRVGMHMWIAPSVRNATNGSQLLNTLAGQVRDNSRYCYGLYWITPKQYVLHISDSDFGARRVVGG